MVRMGILPANADANADAKANAYAYADAYAYAYADAYAYAYADAYTYAYANADADADAKAYADAKFPPLNFSGGKHLNPGLYFYQQQSGNLAVLRVGWVRRVEGDEYEVLNLVTPLRDGDYTTLFADVANKGPPKKWRFSEPVWAASPTNRFHILGPLPLKPEQWKDICPKPKGWVEE
jgi:hypothetical protein